MLYVVKEAFCCMIIKFFFEQEKGKRRVSPRESRYHCGEKIAKLILFHFELIFAS